MKSWSQEIKKTKKKDLKKSIKKSDRKHVRLSESNVFILIFENEIFAPFLNKENFTTRKQETIPFIALRSLEGGNLVFI